METPFLQKVEKVLFAVRRRVEYDKMRTKSLFPHEFAVCGSYSTGNLGDKAIGEAIQAGLQQAGRTCQLYSHRSDNPRGEYRILGGGGVLHDYQPEILERRLAYVRDGGVAIGVGALTISNEKYRTRIGEALDSAELVTVRDRYSKEILQPLTKTNIEVTACPAFTLEPSEAVPGYTTGVNFRPWFNQSQNFLSRYYNYSVDPNEARDEYIKNISKILDEVNDPVFIPFDHDDYLFAKKYLDIPVLSYTYSVNKTLKRVNSVSQMICMRYHSLVFASICNVPSFVVRYAPKVDELVSIVDVPSTQPTEFQKPTFEEPNHVRELRKESNRNFELVNDIAFRERAEYH